MEYHTIQLYTGVFWWGIAVDHTRLVPPVEWLKLGIVIIHECVANAANHLTMRSPSPSDKSERIAATITSTYQQRALHCTRNIVTFVKQTAIAYHVQR